VNGKRARELNEMIRYTAWSVFRAVTPLAADRAAVAAEVEQLFEQLAAKDVVVRGTYDVSALRADADLLVWWHAASPTTCRRRTGGSGAPSSAGRWSRCGRSSRCTGRPSSTRATCRPSSPRRRPRGYVCVYPFVRSYEWYLLPDKERREMLAEHGRMAREYPDVRANTVASFALGDYEWILAFEADELDRIVDLMRHLRGSVTRRHVARRSRSTPAAAGRSPTSSPRCPDPVTRRRRTGTGARARASVPRCSYGGWVCSRSAWPALRRWRPAARRPARSPTGLPRRR
jgi:chlorite dismutase